MPNIAIVWDFDGTLSPDDSTTKTVEIISKGKLQGSQFWGFVKSLHTDKKNIEWEHVLAMDAPIWMYSLSRIAAKERIPLNKEFFKKFVLPHIKLYPNASRLMQRIKDLETTQEFQNINLKVHHFIITAGLKDLVEEVFPKDLIRWTFGCRYTVVASPGYEDEPESIPVFCMDETVKTRSLFEISKGVFCKDQIEVNSKVEKADLWADFNNIIYVGDGDTDVPAFSLVRNKGGLGIAVYNPMKPIKDREKRLRKLRLNKRTDFITPSDFSLKGDLFAYIKARCIQIRQRYEAAEGIMTE